MESIIPTIGIAKDQILSVLLEHCNKYSNSKPILELFQNKRFNDRKASLLYKYLRLCEKKTERECPIDDIIMNFQIMTNELFSEDNDVFPVSLVDAGPLIIDSSTFEPENIFLYNFDYHINGIFSHKAKSSFITRLWFRKMHNKWEWTPYDPFVRKGDTSVWISVSNLIVTIGEFIWEKPANINRTFINWLNKWNPEKPLKYLNQNDYDLNSTIKVLDIITPSNQEIQTKTKTNTTKQVIRNDTSKCTQTETITYTETITNQCAFQIKGSARLHGTVKFEAQVPFICKSNVDLGAGLQGEIGRTWTTTETKTITITRSIQVPPKNVVEVSTNINSVKNLEMSFKAKEELTILKKNNVPSDDNDDNFDHDGAFSKYILKIKNCDLQSIVEATKEKVTLSIDGLLKADYFLDSYVDIKEIPFEQQNNN